MGLSSDIRILEAQLHFQTERTRHGLTFGRQQTADLTLCHVRVRVENRHGRTADGWGAVFLSYPWALAQVPLSDQAKDQLMRSLTVAFAERAAEHRGFGYPLGFFAEFESEWQRLSSEVAHGLGLQVEVPRLAQLVCASPLDAAIHDAFGVVNGLSSYAAYGPELTGHDLAMHLGPGFAGRYISEFLCVAPASRVPVAHTVGLRDELTAAGEDATEAGEAHPTTLDRWIERDGVYCFKIKLAGQLEWDRDRLVDIYEVASCALANGSRREVQLSVDFNGECDSPDYVVELLHRIRERSAEAFSALRYVEQPVAPGPSNDDMREVAALKPVILDEGFTGLDDLNAAPDHGWSGVALKTCKCHSLNLLALARAESLGLHYFMQDLSNVGIAFMHSIGLASRFLEVASVEANGRQYYPEASEPEAIAHPEVMRVVNGTVSTTTLEGPGLGYQIGRIHRPMFQGAS